MYLLGSRLLATFTAFTLITASIGPVATAAAQEASGEKYHEIIKRAVQEFDLGNWQEARALFRQAHRINPNARTLRGMGMAAFEMRSYLPALKDLEAALRDKRKPLTEKQREHVKGLIEQTRAFLGRYRIEVEPQNATLQVDGNAASLDEDKTLVLDLGEHEIVAMASGYQEQKRQITVEGGEDQVLSLMLEPIVETAEVAPAPVAAEAQPPSEPEPAEAEDKPEDKAEEKPAQAPAQQKWDWPEEEDTGPVWAWVALGAAALSAGVAGLFWAQGESRYNKLEKECELWCDQEDRDKAADEIESFDTLTNVFLVMSGVLVGGAVVLFVVESSGGSSESKQAAAVTLEVVPAGARLSGRF